MEVAPLLNAVFHFSSHYKLLIQACYIYLVKGTSTIKGPVKGLRNT
jgi:hypothetical protein